MLYSLVSNGRLQGSDQAGPNVPWWSFTKTVLAATALSLVRDGLIGLDDHVPDERFTLRQLLRHEAGFADYGELPAYHAAVANGESAWPVEDMMQRLDGTRLRYDPGTGWRYSNVCYWRVGRLIERLTALTLDEAVDGRTLAPLGLSNVRFAKTREDMRNNPHSAASDYDPAWVYHGLLIGPLSQAALFLDRLLAGGLLPPSLIREMRTARMLGGPIAGRPWATASYGLGVMQGSTDEGATLCGHTGQGPDSTFAVYRTQVGDVSACCAVYALNGTEGFLETVAVERLMRTFE
ncbi:serine hydrolase domain-containing protein [Pseudomonas sp.]|uniref:serine hydrolase domain-containing protein n=1 Tax=Pseudomonas sp. TaxID=306 RepID=UPI0028AB097B|nr:serine hydrolase domain-containing protein [Pseudomonas sp.]